MLHINLTTFSLNRFIFDYYYSTMRLKLSKNLHSEFKIGSFFFNFINRNGFYVL